MLRRFAAVATAALVLGCDSTEPSLIAGIWIATEFVITEEGSDPVDVLEAGGSMTIIVSSNNSTTGALVIPASVTGEAVNASMAGTATLDADGFAFDQAADTFVRDMDFALMDRTLIASETFGGTRIDLTLTRQ